MNFRSIFGRRDDRKQQFEADSEVFEDFDDFDEEFLEDQELEGSEIEPPVPAARRGTRQFSGQHLGLSGKKRKRKPLEFRINARHLFLTYSQTILTKEEVLEQLQKKFLIEGYVISQENHKDMEDSSLISIDNNLDANKLSGKHIHVYLKLAKTINIVSPRALDLIDSTGLNVHGQYEAVRKAQFVIDYIKKDGDFITNIEDYVPYEVKLEEILLTKGLDAAMKYFKEQKPTQYVSRYNSVRSNLKSILLNNKKDIELKYPAKDYDYPQEIVDWYENEKDSKTLLVTGPSGVGKTEGMISLLKELNPLLVTEINSFKSLKDSNLGFILDDIDWSKLSTDEKIHIFDKDRAYDIRVLYDTVSLDPRLVKVVTSNSTDGILDRYSDPSGAIARRIKHVYVDKPMFIYVDNRNVTLNVEVNQVLLTEEEKHEASSHESSLSQ